MQMALFEPVQRTAELPDPQVALECAGNQALLTLVDGPLEFAELVDVVKGPDHFRHHTPWISTLTFSWWLGRLESAGRLVSTKRYYGSRSPAEGNYHGYTHTYSLPSGNSGEAHGDHNH